MNIEEIIKMLQNSGSGELLLLIDDNSAMIPFSPVLHPLIEAIASSGIKSVRIYQFTSYPDGYLYHWDRPSQSESLTQLLPKLHRGTIALIFSDAGAATHSNSQERIQGISQFLRALSVCTQQIIWLNPLPPVRWEETSAWAINTILGGEMVEYQPNIPLRTAQEVPQGIDQVRIGSDLISCRLRVFEKSYGTKALDLACHAAFPLALTSDLLYCLRENFVLNVPWYTVADVLLSGLCQPAGYDLYVMAEETRSRLIQEIRERFGERRLKDLDNFMSGYIVSAKGRERGTMLWVSGDRR